MLTCARALAQAARLAKVTALPTSNRPKLVEASVTSAPSIGWATIASALRSLIPLLSVTAKLALLNAPRGAAALLASVMMANAPARSKMKSDMVAIAGSALLIGHAQDVGPFCEVVHSAIY